MKIKVCGISTRRDLLAIQDMGVEYVGFIFVPSSPRFLLNSLDAVELKLVLNAFPQTSRVGVFANENAEVVRAIAKEYALTSLQFHGDESPLYCSEFADEFEVIKSFSIGSANDFDKCAAFETSCKLFVFDTEGPLLGGNGTSWDWKLMSHYSGSTPFLVSGGIGPDDISKIRAVTHNRFLGIDINSKFETAPGMKNVETLIQFVGTVKTNSNEVFG